MLVVLIIGIVTSFAVYSMAPIGPGRQAKSEAQGLMAAIDYAQQHAILSHQPYGLVIDNRGYQFFVYEGLEQGQWQATQNPGLKQIETLSQIKLILPTPNLDGIAI